MKKSEKNKEHTVKYDRIEKERKNLNNIIDCKNFDDEKSKENLKNLNNNINVSFNNDIENNIKGKPEKLLNEKEEILNYIKKSKLKKNNTDIEEKMEEMSILEINNSKDISHEININLIEDKDHIIQDNKILELNEEEKNDENKSKKKKKDKHRKKEKDRNRDKEKHKEKDKDHEKEKHKKKQKDKKQKHKYTEKKRRRYSSSESNEDCLSSSSETSKIKKDEKKINEKIIILEDDKKIEYEKLASKEINKNEEEKEKEIEEKKKSENIEIDKSNEEETRIQLKRDMEKEKEITSLAIRNKLLGYVDENAQALEVYKNYKQVDINSIPNIQKKL